MIPASFAPMLLKLIMPKMMDHFMKVFKLDKVLRYVEQPNELDAQMEDVEKKCSTIDSKIKAMEDMLIELDKDSHPKKPFEERITALEKKLAK